jgi:LacI family transcriptional regulator
VDTIKDIAKYTGLALSTISKYLNNGVVREKNRKKIEEALRVLDYRPNEAARSLKTNKSMTIGMIIPNLRSSFDATIIALAEEELTSAGYSAIICGYHRDIGMEASRLRFLLNKRVDGLVIVPSGTAHDEFLGFVRENRPVVLVDRPLRGLSCDTILIDNVAAAAEAVACFLENGHRRIGIIAGSEDIFTGRMRLKGYLKAHRDFGIPIDHGLVCHGDWTSASGYTQTFELLKRDRKVTALLVCGDDMGFGALKAIQDLSLRVPEDISLVCFDIFQMAEILRPKIATVEQPINEIGRLAAKLLLRRLSEASRLRPHRTHILKASFYKRDSIKRMR